MRAKFCLRYVILAAVAFVIPSFADTSSESALESFVSGKHSFKNLGSQFYVPVRVKAVAGARLLLFNFQLADRLGISYPRDPGELENWALRRFALRTTSETGPDTREYFSTRYQDNKKKGPGEAEGDGRAIWMGEIKTTNPLNGRIETLDVVAKGIGITPLAWLNHPRDFHRDGNLGLDEGIYSFVMSQALKYNELATTEDLLVIEMPHKRNTSDGGAGQRTAVSVRIGSQTRFAHWKNFKHHPGDLAKVLDYTIGRDLGYPGARKLHSEDYDLYFRTLAQTLGEEAARNVDLLGAHGSPTLGNRTTMGASIDNATYRFLNALHVNHPYLWGQLKYGKNYEQFEHYLVEALRYTRLLKDHGLADVHYRAHDYVELMKQNYDRMLSELVLRRHGFSAEQMRKLSPTRKQIFAENFIRLAQTTDDHPVIYDQWNSIVPAYLEMRKVVPATLDLLRRNESPTFERILAMTQESDQTREVSAVAGIRFKTYIESLNDILMLLKPDRAELAAMKARADAASSGDRYFNHRDLRADAISRVLSTWDSTTSVRAASSRAQSEAQRLQDQGLPPHLSFLQKLDRSAQSTRCPTWYSSSASELSPSEQASQSIGGGR